MDYGESLRWLATLPDFERTGDFAERPDLLPMRALLDALGAPHRGRPTLHIAGSKGKGSTGAIAEAVLRAGGVRTGHYISPHLHRHTERIRIDGQPVAEDVFAGALARVREALPGVEARFPGRQILAFDVLTAAAFLAFRDAGVGAQVIEVGLGGTLDSTNVFHDPTEGERPPHVAVLTPISLEHTAILGDTIAAIAAQKARIITAGSVAVAAPQRESALDVFAAVAQDRGARLVQVAASCQLERSRADGDGQEFRLRTPRATYGARLSLAGRHQLENAATAVLACEELAALSQGALPAVTADGVRRALGAVAWPARLETLKRRPLLVIDGAHNGDSVKRMAAALREDFRLESAVLVFGTLAGKDVAAMAAQAAPLATHVIVPRWPSPRAAPAREAAEALRALGVPVTEAPSVGDAIAAALAEAGERGAVVAFGALAFAAAVREWVLGIAGDQLTNSPGREGPKG